MTITIPETIRYDRRDYTVNQVIELDDSMKSGDASEHPLFILMLKYLSSPFSDNNYNEIEDNLSYFLKPGFMNKISETDKDIEFDEEEYRQHIKYVWNAIKDLTAEELLTQLKTYVGDYTQIDRALKQGLLDEGKSVKLSDVNTELGTDHLLSAHTKGIESKKIWQAADKGARYTEALDSIDEFTKVVVSNPVSTQIELPNARNKSTVQEQTYEINIDFKGVFNKLFMEAGIKPEVLRGSENSKSKKPKSNNSSDEALAEAIQRANKVKKSLELIIKNEFLDIPDSIDNKKFGISEDEEYNYREVVSYKPHSDYPLSSEEEDILAELNLKLAWNALLADGEFKYEDEVSSGDMDAEEVVARMREGQMDEVGNLAEKLADFNLMTYDAYDALINDGKVPGKRGFNKKERKLITDVIEFKSNLKMPVGRTEFESALREKQTTTIRRKITENMGRRTLPIVHNEQSDKKLFKDDSWKTPDQASIDLLNGARNSRELKQKLDLALVPKKVGVLRIELVVIHGTDQEKADRKELLNDDDSDVRGNSQYLLDKVWDVFRLKSVSYVTSTEYAFKDYVERRPESKSGNNPKAKKLKISDYVKPTVRRGESPLRGRIDAGGQPMYINPKTNTMLYYIKKQMSSLERVLQWVN